LDPLSTTLPRIHQPVYTPNSQPTIIPPIPYVAHF
jgi:hypothetical protein